jgi:nucleotide-binding universal stress UspA family protein
MGYKDVLVYIDPSPDNDNRLDLAISIAQSHGARLIGVDASSDTALEARRIGRAVVPKDLFEEKTKKAGISARFHGRDRDSNVVRYAYYADLLIASQPEFDKRKLVVPAVPEEALLKSGVPMLILPYNWQFQPVGERVVIAWNASREATRAIHDAMPILERAKEVTVFEVRSGVTDGLPTEEKLIVDHLQAHGVNAKAEWSDTNGLSVVEALFASLDDKEPDLIVAGAYGQSRLFEGLFGGASHDLVRQPSLPVLMSH